MDEARYVVDPAPEGEPPHGAAHGISHAAAANTAPANTAPASTAPANTAPANTAPLASGFRLLCLAEPGPWLTPEVSPTRSRTANSHSVS